MSRRYVQAIVDGLVASGASASSVWNAVMPLRVIFRRALEDGDLAHNPCEGLRLPRVQGRRETIVSAEKAAMMIVALTARRDRAIYRLAFYAGLRRGQILGLRWPRRCPCGRHAPCRAGA